MDENKKLVMIFRNSAGKNVTISIDDPKDDLTEEQIKTAYKRLVKQYHPDTGNTANVEYYHRIVEAYEYLKLHPVQVQMNYGKVFKDMDILKTKKTLLVIVMKHGIIDMLVLA